MLPALSALESMDKEFEILKTHEGRVRITTFSMWKSWKISLLLMFRYGFYRWGIYIPPITDEAIHPNYIRGNLKISAGWDNWYGYDWFAANDITDQFLTDFYHKHCTKK